MMITVLEKGLRVLRRCSPHRVPPAGLAIHGGVVMAAARDCPALFALANSVAADFDE